MAVYERTYRSYEGGVTPEWSRFLVLPRYAFAQVFASKAFLAFFVLCFVYPLVSAVAIYLPHNLKFLEAFQIQKEQIIQVTEMFFPMQFMRLQGIGAFLITLFVSPALVSVDMRNNGMPLYLSRPFSRREYIGGKISVLFLLLSAITWVPGLLLYALQAYLMGFEWLGDNLRTGAAIFLGSWLWILVLSLLSLAISAHVRMKPVARVVLLGAFFFGFFFAPVLNIAFGITGGRMLIFLDMVQIVWSSMFGVEAPIPYPVWQAWLSLTLLTALSTFLLVRKIKAYEVIR
ncbi:hypothetical protein ABI59_20930 [Acidobacteria bacterium Mor1]|nr:hypothetical protein ABI59_20930 [Acidobacteria bacterium Mor1]